MTEKDAAFPEVGISSVVIERAVPEDAEAICAIRDQARLETYPNPEQGISEADIRMIIQGPHGEFVPRRIAYYREEIAKSANSKFGILVAKSEGNVVGFTHPETDDKGRRTIGDMFVAPEAQGKGIGGKLMDQALDVLGHDEDIYLDVVSYNSKAIGFYEHYGFEKTDAAIPREEGRPSYLKSLPQIEMVRKGQS